MSRVGITLEVRDDASAVFERVAQKARATAQELEQSVGTGSTRATQSVNKFAESWEAQHKRVQTQSVGNVVAQDHAKTEAAFKSLQGQLGVMDSALSQAGVNTGLLGKIIGALTSPLGLAAVGLGALTAGVLSVTTAMIRNAQEVRALMAVSGLEAEAADNLADTFQLLGKDSAVLTSALFKMAQEIDTGGAGLRKLGLSFQDVIGTANEGELFLLVRDKISAMGSATQRSAALMDVFGRSGRELAPIFALSREEFRRFMDEAGALSPWSAEMQQRTQALIIEQTKLGMVWDGMKIRVGELVTGPLTALLAMFTKLITPTAELSSSQLERLWEQRLIGYGEYLTKRQALDAADAAKTAQGLAAQRAGERVLVEQSATEQAKMRDLRALHAKAVADQSLARTLGVLAIEDAARQAQLQNGGLMAAQAAQARVAAVDVELAAKLKALAAELAAVKNKDDLLGTGAVAVQAKITAAHQEATAKRITLTAAAEKAQQDYDERIRTVSLGALRQYAGATDGLTRRFEAQARVEVVLQRETERMVNEYEEAIRAEHELEGAAAMTREEFDLMTTDLEEHNEQLRESSRGWSMFARDTAASARTFSGQFDLAFRGFRAGFGEVVDRTEDGFEQMRSVGISTALSMRSGFAEFFNVASKEFLDFETLATGVMQSIGRSIGEMITDATLAIGKGFLTGNGSSGLLGGLGASAAGALFSGGNGFGGFLGDLFGSSGPEQLAGPAAESGGGILSAIGDFFGGIFQRGGIVPGGPTQPKLVIAHGQEAILNLPQQAILFKKLEQLTAGAAPGSSPGGFFRGVTMLPELGGEGGGGVGVGAPGNPGFTGPAPSSFSQGTFRFGGLLGQALGINSFNLGPLSINPTTVAMSLLGLAIPGFNMMSMLATAVTAPLVALSILATKLGLQGQDTSGQISDADATAANFGFTTTAAAFAALTAGIPGTQAQQAVARAAAPFGQPRGDSFTNTADPTEGPVAPGVSPTPADSNEGLGIGATGDGGVGPAPGAPGGTAGAPAGGGDSGNSGDFARGGRVPGSYPGQPRWVRAHAGEEFMGVGQWRRPSAPGVVIQSLVIHADTSDADWIRKNAREIRRAVEDELRNVRARA